MVKICDFGLARDIYKNPDYVRKGDVSGFGVYLTLSYPVIFKPQPEVLGKYLHFLGSHPPKLWRVPCVAGQAECAANQRVLAGDPQRPLCAASVCPLPWGKAPGETLAFPPLHSCKSCLCPCGEQPGPFPCG